MASARMLTNQEVFRGVGELISEEKTRGIFQLIQD